MPAILRSLYYLPSWLIRVLMSGRSVRAGYGSAAPADQIALDQAVLAKDRFSVPGVVAQAAAIANYSTTLDDVRKLAMPSLVLHGDEDTVVPFEWGVELANTLPNSRFMKLEGVGHNFLVGAGETATAAVLDFLSDVDTTDAGGAPNRGGSGS